MNAFEWASSPQPTEPPPDWYCKTSDVWQGRFTKLAPLLIKRGMSAELATLITSAIGEIGDNCFTHNSSAWIDVPGCWFEYQIDGEVHCCVADRGRGILTSLKAVRPNLATHADALLVALTERITGRAPEKRGNGLKYVVNVLQQMPNGSFRLQSGDAVFACALPLDGNDIKSYITKSATSIRGTYGEIIFRYD